MNDIAWKCMDCSWSNTSPNMGGPIMHEVTTGHKTYPADKAIREWGKVL